MGDDHVFHLHRIKPELAQTTLDEGLRFPRIVERVDDDEARRRGDRPCRYAGNTDEIEIVEDLRGLGRGGGGCRLRRCGGAGQRAQSQRGPDIRIVAGDSVRRGDVDVHGVVHREHRRRLSRRHVRVAPRTDADRKCRRRKTPSPRPVAHAHLFSPCHFSRPLGSIGLGSTSARARPRAHSAATVRYRATVMGPVAKGCWSGLRDFNAAILMSASS